MKKLAILSSLALLVAPSFKGNAFTDLARNQIKMIDEAGDSSVSYEKREAVIHFGSKVDSTCSAQSATVTENHYKVTDYTNLSLTFSSACFGNSKNGTTTGDDDTKNYPLRINSGNKAAQFKITFTNNENNGQIVEKVVFSAQSSSSKKDGCKITVSTSYDNASPSYEGSIVSTGFTDYTISNLDLGNKTATTYLDFAGTKDKSTYISLIKVYILVPVPRTATVTYNYGATVENSDFSTKTETVTKGETTNPPLKDGYTYSDWDGTRELVGWYTDEAKTEAFDFSTTITEDITLYAKWKVTADSAEVTNLKSSETKSQLYYEYDSWETKNASLFFGEQEATGGNMISSSGPSYYKCDDNFGTNKPTLTFTNCYSGGSRESESDESKNYAVRILKGASLEITFDPAAYVREMIVYARGANKDDNVALTVVSTNSEKETINTITNNVKVGTENVFTAYRYKGIDGLNGGEHSSSITISTSNDKRVFVSKIEFVIAEKPTSETPYYEVSDIGLRFGGLVKQSYFDSLKDHITNFGLIYATDLGDHKTLADALNDESVTTTKLNQTITSEVTPYLTTVDDESYYVFNAFFNVSSTSESITKVVYAIATLTLDNGETIYFNEKSNSVATIAQEYLDTNKYDGAVKETLTLLSQGKTKTTDTTESN